MYPHYTTMKSWNVKKNQNWWNSDIQHNNINLLASLWVFTSACTADWAHGQLFNFLSCALLLRYMCSFPVGWNLVSDHWFVECYTQCICSFISDFIKYSWVWSPVRGWYYPIMTEAAQGKLHGKCLYGKKRPKLWTVCRNFAVLQIGFGTEVPKDRIARISLPQLLFIAIVRVEVWRHCSVFVYYFRIL